MFRLYVLVAIFIGFTLSSCTTTSNPTQSGPTKAKTLADLKPAGTIKSPLAVQVYPKGVKLTHPYKIITKETVSKYNSGGIKRQEANIHDALRNLAASAGGDAIINVTRDEHKVTGTVITFETNKVG